MGINTEGMKRQEGMSLSSSGNSTRVMPRS